MRVTILGHDDGAIEMPADSGLSFWIPPERRDGGSFARAIIGDAVGVTITVRRPTGSRWSFGAQFRGETGQDCVITCGPPVPGGPPGLTLTCPDVLLAPSIGRVVYSLTTCTREEAEEIGGPCADVPQHGDPVRATFA